MLLVGAISITIATLFSLIALCMFFDTDAKIRFAVILSYLLLVLVIISVLVAVIRWLKVLINTGRFGKNKCCRKYKREFQIAFIILGTICSILALFSAIGIFIFAKKLENISSKAGNYMSNKSSPSEAGSSWNNEICTENPNSTACTNCIHCPNRQACDACEKNPVACKRCKCSPKGFLCGMFQPEEENDGISWHNQTCTEDPNSSACLNCMNCPNRQVCDVCEENLTPCRRCKCGTKGFRCAMFEPKVEENDGISWHNQTCIEDPNSSACLNCVNCPNRQVCDVCEENLTPCRRCKCGTKGFRCAMFEPKEEENDEDSTQQPPKELENENITETEPKRENPLKAFLGEPADDSPCKNVPEGIAGIERMFCQLYEVTNSWHCKNESGKFEIEKKIECVMKVVEKGATKRYIVAVLLIVCTLGHLVSVSAAICCSGDDDPNSKKGYEYSPQSDDNDDKGEKENGTTREAEL